MDDARMPFIPVLLKGPEAAAICHDAGVNTRTFPFSRYSSSVLTKTHLKGERFQFRNYFHSARESARHADMSLRLDRMFQVNLDKSVPTIGGDLVHQGFWAIPQTTEDRDKINVYTEGAGLLRIDRADLCLHEGCDISYVRPDHSYRKSGWFMLGGGLDNLWVYGSHRPEKGQLTLVYRWLISQSPLLDSKATYDWVKVDSKGYTVSGDR